MTKSSKASHLDAIFHHVIKYPQPFLKFQKGHLNLINVCILYTLWELTLRVNFKNYFGNPLHNPHFIIDMDWRTKDAKEQDTNWPRSKHLLLVWVTKRPHQRRSKGRHACPLLFTTRCLKMPQMFLWPNLTEYSLLSKANLDLIASGELWKKGA